MHFSQAKVIFSLCGSLNSFVHAQTAEVMGLEKMWTANNIFQAGCFVPVIYISGKNLVTREVSNISVAEEDLELFGT